MIYTIFSFEWHFSISLLGKFVTVLCDDQTTNGVHLFNIDTSHSLMPFDFSNFIFLFFWYGYSKAFCSLVHANSVYGFDVVRSYYIGMVLLLETRVLYLVHKRA